MPYSEAWGCRCLLELRLCHAALYPGACGFRTLDGALRPGQHQNLFNIAADHVGGAWQAPRDTDSDAAECTEEVQQICGVTWHFAALGDRRCGQTGCSFLSRALGSPCDPPSSAPAHSKCSSVPARMRCEYCSSLQREGNSGCHQPPTLFQLRDCFTMYVPNVARFGSSCSIARLCCSLREVKKILSVAASLTPHGYFNLWL